MWLCKKGKFNMQWISRVFAIFAVFVASWTCAHKNFRAWWSESDTSPHEQHRQEPWAYKTETYSQQLEATWESSLHLQIIFQIQKQRQSVKWREKNLASEFSWSQHGLTTVAGRVLCKDPFTMAHVSPGHSCKTRLRTAQLSNWGRLKASLEQVNSGPGAGICQPLPSLVW